MKGTKPLVRGGMKLRAYDVLRRAVEEGAAYGWRRAHKHTDTPGEDAIVDQIVQGVLNEICEYFDFDDEDRPA
jgi:predicted Zn-dependent protease with MMP-like domain